MAQSDEQVWILAALALAVLGLAALVWRLMQGKPDALPDDGPLRLLVRPLKELRPDAGHLYLGTAIARDIAGGLKAFERLEPALGEALSNLSVDGSVSKTGPRIVMNVRLLNGRHAIWTGTYDGAISDLPRMQAEIVANVARKLGVAPHVPARASPPPAS